MTADMILSAIQEKTNPENVVWLDCEPHIPDSTPGGKVSKYITKQDIEYILRQYRWEKMVITKVIINELPPGSPTSVKPTRYEVIP